MIWPFFRLCSLPVTFPIEVLKTIWKWNTCSPQNIPFHLLLSFVLISLWCLYCGQRGKKVKGCLFISIFILGKGTEKAKWWLLGHCLVCEDAISNICFVADPNSFPVLPQFWWQKEFCASDRCWWLWWKIAIVNGAHGHHGKDKHAKTICTFMTFLTSYCLTTPN